MRPGIRHLAGTLGSVVVFCATRSVCLGAEGGGHPELAETLRRAGAWIERFADESVAVVGSEEYVQEYRRRGAVAGQQAAAPGAPVEQRTLVSEVAVARTTGREAAAGYPWVQFRDVVAVDGEPLPDHRGRLEHLLAGTRASSYGEAATLTAESARYNIGPGTRTVNVPLFALFFLVPANQPRFRFDWKGEEPAGATPLAVIAYRERERPTMIRSPRGGGDRPARGLFWIDSLGRVVKSRLVVDADGWTMETEVTFGWDVHVEAWVPMTMVEHHRRGHDESLDCTAKYSNYRRFSTGARIIDR